MELNVWIWLVVVVLWGINSWMRYRALLVAQFLMPFDQPATQKTLDRPVRDLTVTLWFLGMSLLVLLTIATMDVKSINMVKLFYYTYTPLGLGALGWGLVLTGAMMLPSVQRRVERVSVPLYCVLNAVVGILVAVMLLVVATPFLLF